SDAAQEEVQNDPPAPMRVGDNGIHGWPSPKIHHRGTEDTEKKKERKKNGAEKPCAFSHSLLDSCSVRLPSVSLCLGGSILRLRNANSTPRPVRSAVTMLHSDDHGTLRLGSRGFAGSR